MKKIMNSEIYNFSNASKAAKGFDHQLASELAQPERDKCIPFSVRPEPVEGLLKIIILSLIFTPIHAANRPKPIPGKPKSEFKTAAEESNARLAALRNETDAFTQGDIEAVAQFRQALRDFISTVSIYAVTDLQKIKDDFGVTLYRLIQNTLDQYEPEIQRYQTMSPEQQEDQAHLIKGRTEMVKQAMFTLKSTMQAAQ